MDPSFFCLCVAITKISGRNNIKGERLILAYDFREFQPEKSRNHISARVYGDSS